MSATPKSERYVALRNRLSELAAHLLPPEFDALGVYPSEQATRTSAYRVLAHAEIESFIEDRAQAIVLSAVRRWKKEGTATRTLVCLLAFSGRSPELPPESVAAPQANKKDEWQRLLEISLRVDAATKAFHGRLQVNHGVKEENMLAVLLPVGVPHDALDPQLLTELDSFGIARGETAHKAAMHLVAIPDPRTEYQRVERIAEMLAVVDEALSRLAA